MPSHVFVSDNYLQTGTFVITSNAVIEILINCRVIIVFRNWIFVERIFFFEVFKQLYENLVRNSKRIKYFLNQR